MGFLSNLFNKNKSTTTSKATTTSKPVTTSNATVGSKVSSWVNNLSNKAAQLDQKTTSWVNGLPNKAAQLDQKVTNLPNAVNNWLNKNANYNQKIDNGDYLATYNEYMHSPTLKAKYANYDAYQNDWYLMNGDDRVINKADEKVKSETQSVSPDISQAASDAFFGSPESIDILNNSANKVISRDYHKAQIKANAAKAAEPRADTENRKYNNINPKTGQPEVGSYNPSGFYAVSTDPKTGIWTDQLGFKHRADGSEVVNEHEFNSSTAMQDTYQQGLMMPVTDASGKVVDQTYVNYDGTPTRFSDAYKNYYGYNIDKSAGATDAEDYASYIAAAQALADSGALGSIPESEINNGGPEGGPGGGGGSSGGGSGGGASTGDFLYSMPEVGNYAMQSVLNNLIPSGYDYSYDKRLAARLADLAASEESFKNSAIPTIANAYQDQAANTLANLQMALRANRASGLVSGASRGAQAASDIQAIQSANKENSSSLEKLINDNVASYLVALANKRATAGNDTATELNAYYSPIASALSNILGNYNYGSAAAQVNNGGLQRAQSYLV